MGQGSYRASDWQMLRQSRRLQETSAPSEVFDSKTAKDIFNSRMVAIRESRDSADSPCSTPILLGFDVTASMGYLAKELAVHALHSTVMHLLEDRSVTDPQILCAAVGDSRCDRVPLQVTQFESDIRILTQLLQLHLEGGGGGNQGESYHLLWYFAARHTRTDCFEKRHRKGYLLTIGDDRCHPSLSPGEIRRVFGDEVPYMLSSEELLREAAQRYHLFHIHLSSDRPEDRSIPAEWRRLLPNGTAELHRRHLGCLSELIAAMISLAGGIPVNTVLKRMNQNIAEIIAPSVALIRPEPETSGQIILF